MLIQRGERSAFTKILGALHENGGVLTPEAKQKLLAEIAEAGFSKAEVSASQEIATKMKGTPFAEITAEIAKAVLGRFADQGRIKTIIANLRDKQRPTIPSKDWINHMPPPASREKIAEWTGIVNQGQDILANTVNLGELHRGFHAKGAGELADFVIYPNAMVPDDARVGWLAKNEDDPAKPVKQQGVARASNGQGCPYLSDKSADVRGMGALVPGLSLTATNQTQGQHVASAEDFVKFAQANVEATAKGHSGLVGQLDNGAAILKKFKLEAPDVLFRISRDTLIPPESLALETYVGSIVRLGDYMVKVNMVPADDAGAPVKVDAKDPDALKNEWSARGPKKFLLCVQFYTNEHDTPLDDARVRWKSPFIPVGHFQTKRFDDPLAQRRCETLIDLMRINPKNIDAGPAPKDRPELKGALFDAMSGPRGEIYDGSADKRGAMTEVESLAVTALLHRAYDKTLSAADEKILAKLNTLADQVDGLVLRAEKNRLSPEEQEQLAKARAEARTAAQELLKQEKVS